MKLVIGGAYQGKREYAIRNFGSDNIIEDFHIFVLDLVNKGVEPEEYIRENMDFYKDMTIIADDIFCGVVPEDPLMRRWREAAGGALNLIAGEADEVVRVFCGLGIRLK